MKTRTFITTGLFGIWLSVTSVQANDLSRMSDISTNVSTGPGMIVSGSATTIVGGEQLLVSSIHTAGESLLLTLKSSADTGTVSLRVPAAVVGTASIAVGTVVQVVAESTGYALLASGKVISFVPNEVGKSLIHHSQRGENKQK